MTKHSLKITEELWDALKQAQIAQQAEDKIHRPSICAYCVEVLTEHCRRLAEEKTD